MLVRHLQKRIKDRKGVTFRDMEDDFALTKKTWKDAVRYSARGYGALFLVLFHL